MFADATNTVSSLLHNSSYKQGHTRHHMIKISSMYQYVKRGVVHPIHVPSSENVADVLTKSVLSKSLFFSFTEKMFGSQTGFASFIIRLIRQNFAKFRNDKVPGLEPYISEWAGEQNS